MEKLSDKAITAANWKKVLKEIYGFAPNNWGESNKMNKYDNNHELAKKLKISGQELGNTISFLEEQKLIKTNISNKKEYNAQWIITEKGFNVALDIKKEIYQSFQQSVLIFLTSVLAITAFFNFLNQSYNNKIFVWLYVLLLSIFSLGIYVFFRRSIK